MALCGDTSAKVADVAKLLPLNIHRVTNSLGQSVAVSPPNLTLCLAEAAAPSDSLFCFWAPCTNILTYLLT